MIRNSLRWIPAAHELAGRPRQCTRQLLPSSSRIPEQLAYVARRRGQWDKSESYFNEAERLDPRNVQLLTQHALSYIDLRRFPEALRKLDQVLNITPDDVDTLAFKAGIAQAEGDLPRAAALLAPLHPAADLTQVLATQVYQAIPITETKELVGAIQSAGGHPRFNSLEGRDHFILDIYDRPDVYQWLLQQKRNTSVAKRNQRPN